MFAIFKTGGNQYKVEPGDSLRIEKVDKDPGETLEFDKVLLTSVDGDVDIGQPYLENSKVKAEVLKQDREDKKIVFRYKPKTRQRRKQGHKQPYTEIKVTSID